MGSLAICGARLFDGERFHEDSHLVISDGCIVGITAGSPASNLPVKQLSGGILSPGFVDVQVNGGGGVMLNDAPSSNTMATIAKAHRRFGTTALLPTLITDSREKTIAAIDAAATAHDMHVPGVIGLHLEGPHLDPARKGAHLEKFMRPLLADDIAIYAEAAKRVGILLLTLAPAQTTPEAVAQLSAAGVIVSIGHAQATADEAEALFDAGARGVTHLFNAMSGLSHREPGLVGAALTRGDVWCGIIADGHHVDRRAIEVALAAKQGPGRVFLVTDAMALVGSEQKAFMLNGRQVRRTDGAFCPKLTLEDGTLAGSDIDMATSIRLLVKEAGVPIADALRRATADPADFLGIGTVRGRLVPGARADLVHLDDGMKVKNVWLAEDL